MNQKTISGAVEACLVLLLVSGCAGTKAGKVFEDYSSWVKQQNEKKRAAAEARRAERARRAESGDRPTAQDCAYGSMYERLHCASRRSNR